MLPTGNSVRMEMERPLKEAIAFVTTKVVVALQIKDSLRKLDGVM